MDSQLLTELLTWGTGAGLKIIVALVILFVSFKIINIVSRKIIKSSETRQDKFDKPSVITITRVLKIVLKVLVTVCLVGYLGINISGITALITSLGITAGLAVNGALSNMAGGVLIIINRPFKTGDYISVGEYEGTVDDITLLTTRIITLGGASVYIPNGTLCTGTVVNYTVSGARRIEAPFSVAYGTDFGKVRDAILEEVNKDERIKKAPAPEVVMTAHGNSSLDLNVWVWVDNKDYYGVLYSLTENVEKAFNENGIQIPFPQVDVHVK